MISENDSDTKMLWKINAFLVSVGVEEEKRKSDPERKMVPDLSETSKIPVDQLSCGD